MRGLGSTVLRHSTVRRSGLTVPLFEARHRARESAPRLDTATSLHGFHPSLISPEYDAFLSHYGSKDASILASNPSMATLTREVLPLLEEVESHVRTWPATLWRQIGLPMRIFADLKAALDPNNSPASSILTRCVLLYSIFVAYRARSTLTSSYLSAGSPALSSNTTAPFASFSAASSGLRAGLPTFSLRREDPADAFLRAVATHLPAVGLLHALFGYDGHVAYAAAVHQLMVLSIESSAKARGYPFRGRELPSSLLKTPEARWGWPKEMEKRLMVQPQWRARAETIKSSPYLLCRSPFRAAFQWQPTWRDFGVMVPLVGGEAVGSPRGRKGGAGTTDTVDGGVVARDGGADVLAVCVTILRPNRFLWADQVPYAAGLGEFRSLAAHYACTEEEKVQVRRLVMPPGAADNRSLAALRALCGSLGPLEGVAGALEMTPFQDENMYQAVDLERDLNFRFVMGDSTASREGSALPPADVLVGEPSRRVFTHTTRSGLRQIARGGTTTLEEAGGETARHAEALSSMAPQGGVVLDGGPARGYWQ